MGGSIGINIVEVVKIKGRDICWGGRDMMAVGRPDKRTDSGETDKTRGV